MGILSGLYAGVSGLNANGDAMSVIGNNIANNNTVGFKASRTVFADMLSSSVASAGGSSQIGRGVSMASVDNLMTQGTFENTENNTDLAIEGDGFFIVEGSNNEHFYTRNGAFGWNDDGYLVNAEGYKVQGYSLNDAGNVSGDLTDLSVDTTTLSPPKATENITFTTNLDAAAVYPAEQVGTVIGVERTIDGDPSTMSDPDGVLMVNSSDPTDPATALTITPLPAEAAYNVGSAKAIAAAVNSASGLNAVATISLGTESLGELYHNDPGSGGVDYPFVAGDFVVNGADLAGVVIPAIADEGTFRATVVTNLNAVLNTVNVEAVVEDTGTLTLKSMDGSNIHINNTSGSNLSSYIQKLNGSYEKTNYSGIEIAADGVGVGELTVDVGTDSSYGIVINAGTEGRDAGFDINDPENTSNYANSVTIYDSLGDPHQATVYFVKRNPDTNPLEWEYYVTVDASELDSTATGGQTSGPYQIPSGTGVLHFKEDGTLDPNYPARLNTVPGELVWSNNSDASIQLEINFNTTEWSNDSVVISQDQDGYGSGTVAQLSIDNDGNVIGNYSNGEPRMLYRIAMASFSNTSGLTKAGGSLYSVSNDSGPPIVGTVGSGIGEIFTNSLEQSNVDLAAEFVSMITTQRGYQANSKVITTTDEMLGELINLKR